MVHLNVILTFILFCISSCHGQNSNTERCRSELKKAQSSINFYYQTMEPKYLSGSINNLNVALDCFETKKSAIGLKIEVLRILGLYDKGASFVDSLDQRDFDFEYERSMNYLYFLALFEGSKGNYQRKDSFISKCIMDINAFIEKNVTEKEFNEKVFVDLFSIEKDQGRDTKIESEINSFALKFPNRKEFFEALKLSLLEDTQTAKPVKQ